MNNNERERILTSKSNKVWKKFMHNLENVNIDPFELKNYLTSIPQDKLSILKSCKKVLYYYLMSCIDNSISTNYLYIKDIILNNFDDYAYKKYCLVYSCLNETDNIYCSGHVCPYSSCNRKIGKHMQYCDRHGCSSGCGSIMALKSSYCKNHTCNYNTCSDIKINKSQYCNLHTCSISNCFRSANVGYNDEFFDIFYCDLHKCEYEGCLNKGKLCEKHTCAVDNCTNIIEWKVRNSDNYCIDHKCIVEDCYDPKSLGLYCIAHTCAYTGCSKKGVNYFYCDDHTCNYKYCRSKILNDDVKYCIKHICLLCEYNPTIIKPIYKLGQIVIPPICTDCIGCDCTFGKLGISNKIIIPGKQVSNSKKFSLPEITKCCNYCKCATPNCNKKGIPALPYYFEGNTDMPISLLLNNTIKLCNECFSNIGDELIRIKN